MTAMSKQCPICSAELEVGHKNGLATYQCPAAHGVGIDLVEAYGHLQYDELEAIWTGARQAPLSALKSPISGLPMAEVTFVADDDPTYGNQGDDARQMTIEVDVDNHFGWFSLEELRSMPTGEKQASGLVGMVPLSETAKDSDFFGSLTSDDYGPDESWATQGGGGRMGGMLRGLANRFRVG